ncbi:Holliday junction resolvase RuvX [Candidatus Parcubacteria bacterium]|nr:Holliday junction resolvase RuvX [Candidatus Parcubacteria bacterium]
MKIFLGIDWGEKRIGLAIGNDEIKIANSFGVVKNLDDVLEVIKKEMIDEIVIGIPYSISDFKFPVPEQFLNFLNNFKEKINIPMHEIDERLSSKAADARVGDKKTKVSRDEIAAMIILQDYFDTCEK